MILFLFLFFNIYFSVDYDFIKIKNSHHSSFGVLLDKDQNIISMKRFNFHERKYPWNKMDQYPHSLIEQIIKVEDKRFYKHQGIDVISLLSNFKNALSFKKLRGASTLSMQVVKLLARKKMSKVKQLILALKLESSFSKKEILETYLNLVPLRSDSIGFWSASLRYFNKIPIHLNQSETLVLVSMLNSPNRPWHKIKLRANSLAKKFAVKIKNINIEEKPVLNQPYNFLKTHFISEPQIYQSSLDQNFISKSLEILNENIERNKTQNLNSMSMLIINNLTGEIVSYAYNSSFQNLELDLLKAKRQAGSTLKPFLYSFGIDQKYFTAETKIIDSALELQVQNDVIYRSKNYDKAFHGEVTIREALSSSLNIPAVWALTYIGGELFYKHLKNYFPEMNNNFEFYGPSLALGTLDVSLYELTNAYYHLSQAKYISPETAFIISDILSDNRARHIGFGMNSVLNTPYSASVKTGTSKDMRDNWCIGYTEFYTVGVWAGEITGKPMKNVTGVSGAAPAWREMMDFLMKNLQVQKKIPANILVQNIDSIPRYFIRGTEFKKENQKIETSEMAKILHPLNNTKFAIDPQIPIEAQKLVLKSDTNQNWYIDDKLIGRGKTQFWNLKKGEHLIQLKDQVKILDQVSILVK